MTFRIRIRPAMVLAALAAVLGTVPLPLLAQATGTIRGRVVEGGSGRPLSGAQVVVVGTQRGTVTGGSGDFTITNVPVGTQRLRASLVAYGTAEQSVSVAAGAVAEVRLTLSQSAIALDEVVVTGTTGAVSKRTLGNAITTVNAAEITQKATVASVTELLQARAPGVQILPNSGIPGAAADIRIRGASSLTGGEPVVYVDGVRFSTESLGNFTPSGAGTSSFSGQRTSAFDFINPEDIESIEIIKGPAAATLYGSEAANGVIQIITKKGSRGEQRMQWTGRIEQGWNDWALPIPANYTTCDAAKIRERDRAGNMIWPGCQGLVAGTVITQNPLREDPLALRTGDLRKLTLGVRGGGDRYSFYIAGDQDLNEGVFLNSYSRRRTLRSNFVLSPSSKVDLTINTAYAQANLRLPVGDEAAQGMLLSAFRGRPGRVTGNPLNSGWAFTRAEQANEYNNQTRSDRLTLGSTLNVNPLPWFRNRLTLGLDFTSSLAEILSPPGSTDAAFSGEREGTVAQRIPRNYIYTFDYTGNVRSDLTSDLESTTSFGFQATSKRFETLFAQGIGFGAPDVTLIGTAQSTLGSNAFSENKSLGVFVQEQFGWKNRLFVTGAVRADDNSSFGENFDWIYYPKLSMAWVLSEEPALGRLFELARMESFKLRAAYGHAGQAPAPFAATQTYTIDKAVLGDGRIVSVLRARSLGNPDLKAERGEELEVGFDAGLFDDRMGVELTYYNKLMRDVIIATGAPGSTGFGGTFYGFTAGVLKNLGSTRNTGIELGINATPVVTRPFAWDTRVTLATNDNELTSFGDARVREPISGQSYGAVQQHRLNYPLGGYWAQLPKRNEDGTPVLNTRGAVVLDTATFIGPSAPTREVSFSNTFTLLQNFRVYTLLDYKGGHHIFNYKEYNRCRFQQNCERLNDPSNANNPERVVWTSSIPGAWIEEADFVKLRDVSLSYSLPSVWAQRFRATAASFTVAGRNLALWSDYSGIDPEVNSYGNRNFARADIYPVPMTRRISMSLNFSF